MNFSSLTFSFIADKRRRKRRRALYGRCYDFQGTRRCNSLVNKRQWCVTTSLSNYDCRYRYAGEKRNDTNYSNEIRPFRYIPHCNKMLGNEIREREKQKATLISVRHAHRKLRSSYLIVIEKKNLEEEENHSVDPFGRLKFTRERETTTHVRLTAVGQGDWQTQAAQLPAQPFRAPRGRALPRLLLPLPMLLLPLLPPWGIIKFLPSLSVSLSLALLTWKI